MTSTRFHVGDNLPEQSVTAEPANMKVFSLITADPNPIHWDVQAVERSGLGDRVINQGGLNAGYVMNAVLAWATPPAELRSVTVRFLGNVFAGDTVVAGGIVTAIGVEDGAEIAELEVWLKRENGTPVLSGGATVSIPVDR